MVSLKDSSVRLTERQSPHYSTPILSQRPRLNILAEAEQETSDKRWSRHQDGTSRIRPGMVTSRRGGAALLFKSAASAPSLDFPKPP